MSKAASTLPIKDLDQEDHGDAGVEDDRSRIVHEAPKPY